MNKIYRRLWSTARQCWVVASELTAPRGKAASTVRLGLATAVLLMSSPIALSAEQAEDQEERVPLELAEDLQRWALQSAFSAPQGQASFAVVAPAATIYTQLTKVTDSSYRDSTLEGDLSMVVGSRSLVKGTKSVAFGNQVSVLNDSSTAVGHYVRILGGGYAVGVGTNSVADGIGAVAVGHYARAQSGNSIAMGSGAGTVKGNAGDSKIAIGGNALAGTDGWTGSVALGGQTRATHDSVAIGYGSRTSSNSSVAIGAHSVAGEAKTVSVGNAEIKRRIVNVDDGVVNSDSYDAVNGRQLQGVKNTVTAVQRVANTAKTTADQALANTKLIQAANTNSTIRIGGENTGGILTISNKNGETRYLNGVRNGTLSATSTDAVTGQQLYATNQRLDAAGRSTATGNVISEANKATATGNLSLAMGQVAKANGVAAMALGHGAVAEAGNAVAIGSASGASGAFAVAVGGNAKATHENSVALGEKSVTTGAKQVSVGSATMKRKIINVDDGAINASSSEAVTGKQMHLESQRVSGLVKQASAGGIMYLGAENTGNVLTVSNKDGGKRYVNGVQNATLSASSSDAVTGQQLFATNNSLAGAQRVADEALGKVNSLGGLISGGPTGGMQLGAENNGSELSVRNKSGWRRVISGVHNADLSAGSTEAVTGQQLFATNNNVATAKLAADSALGKANTLGGLISQVAADGNVRLGGENTGAVLDVRNKSNANRTLSGVKDGAVNATSTEAVTGKQLNTTNTEVASVRTVATAAQTTANTAKTTADNALGKASTLGGLISQVAADGNVRLGGENTGAVLDVRNKANANRTLSGLKDGAVSATSTEAVTGKQLNTTNTEVAAVRTVATAAQTTANTAKGTADNALGKANTLGGLVSQVAADGNVRVGGENTGTVLDVRNKANANRTLSGLKDGAVNATSTDAVTGKQLNTTNTEVAAVRTVATAAQTAANTAKGTADNALGKANTLGGLVSQVAADGNVRLGGENTGAVLDVRNKANANRTLSGLKDGAVNATSTEAVTGKQLNTTNTEVASVRTVATAAQTAANAAKSTADNALGKANTLGGLVSQVASDGNVRLGGENTGAVLDVRNKANANRTLSGLKDGAVSATSTEAVTGKQLNTTNTEVASVRTVATAAQTTASTAKSTADNALGKANTLGGLISQVAADGNVRLGGENTGTVLDVRNKSGGARSLSGLADGTISATSTDAVTGKQLFATNEKVEANEGVLAGHTRDLTAQSGRISDNRRDLDALRSEFEDFDPDLDGVVKFAADGSVDIAGGKVRGVAAGDISSATSTDAVNGGQLFETNERLALVERSSSFLAIGRGGSQAPAVSGRFGVALGDSAEASPRDEGAVAVGSYALAWAKNSVALGRSAYVEASAENGFAMGVRSSVEAVDSVAIGASSSVAKGAERSVAIGGGSVASEALTVSFGNDKLLRRLVNVGRGTSDDEAVTLVQLKESLDALGGHAGIDGSGNINAPTYNVQGGTHNNVGDALAALDSAVVTADSRVDTLEGKLRSAFQDGPSVRADGLDQLMLAGANGSVLTNLADGRIAAGSRDAVTGSQLFEAKQEIVRNRNDLNDLRGERDGLLSRGLMAAEQGNVIDYGGARLTGVADGVISANSRDVVSGRQLFVLNESLLGLEAHSRFFKVGYDKESSPANAGLLAVAIGDSAQASLANEGGTAVGSFAKALGLNSVALGRGAAVSESATSGFALGSSSRVDGNGSVAIGAQAWVTAKNSVALGYGSRADEEGTVSVGNASVRRRIVNVANGRNATDAATVGQLRGALATLGGDVDANGNIINPTFNVQGSQQSTLNDALSTLDSAVVTNTTRTERVESQLRAVFQDSPSVRSDGLNQLTFAGANGMVLSNVANGAIAAGSRDAVNGGQLHSMQQQLNGRMDGLEQRIDGQPQAPQSRALTVAAVDSAASSAPVATPVADEPTATPPSSGDNKVVADAGNAPKSSPQPQADAPKPESPTPQVDTAELEKMLARANEYSDGISREVDARLDKMDKRFNRMAAMTSAQSAMAMNTAGLNTYNRLGAGVGYSEGESAMAVGYQRVLNDKGSATFSLNGAFTNSGERSMGVGVGIGW